MIKLSNSSQTEYMDFAFTWPGGATTGTLATLQLNHNKGRIPDRVEAFVNTPDGWTQQYDLYRNGTGPFYGWQASYNAGINDLNNQTIVNLFGNLTGSSQDGQVRMYWFTSVAPGS